MKIRNVKRILIFNPFGIGDVLCSTPLIRNLKDNLPQSSISYICNRRTYPLLRNNKFLDKIMVFEKDEWRESGRKSKVALIKRFFAFKKEIQDDRYDIVFDLSLKSLYGFFFKISGIKNRVGFNFKRRGGNLTHKIELPQGFRDKHVARYYLDLLSFLDIRLQDYKYDLFVTNQSIQEAERILRNHQLDKDGLLIGVCPAAGDSWGKTAYFRRWPKHHFVNLCRKLAEELGAEIIIFGSKNEVDICEYISSHLKEKPLNLCGGLSLDNFIGMLSVSKFIITNDGGPFHIAQALEKKAIGFIGPVDERVYGTYPDRGNYTIFTKDVACRPCYKGFKFPKCRFDKRCLREITVEEVFSKVKELIGSD